MAGSPNFNRYNRAKLGQVIGKHVLIGKWHGQRKAWRMQLISVDSDGQPTIILRNFFVESMRLAQIDKIDGGYMAKISHDWHKTPGDMDWYLKRGWIEMDSALPVETAGEAMCLPNGRIIVNKPILDWSELYMEIAGWKT